MVAPLIVAAGITAGAEILGGLLGNSAAKKQYKLAAQEAARQGLIDARQLELTERMIELGLATQIDAQGNVTTYDEATNTWRVIPSATQAQLQAASDQEILRQFNVDAPLNRGEALKNAVMRAREGDTSAGMLEDVQDQARGVGLKTAPEIASNLRLSRAEAINAGFDDVANALQTHALRTGGPSGSAASALAKARVRALMEGMGNPDLEGYSQAEELNGAKRANSLNMYNTLAARASGQPGFSAPVVNNSALNSAMLNARNGATSTFAQGANSLATLGQPNQVPTVYNPASLISSIGNSLGDLYKVYSESKKPPTNTGKANSGGWTTYGPQQG